MQTTMRFHFSLFWGEGVWYNVKSIEQCQMEKKRSIFELALRFREFEERRYLCHLHIYTSIQNTVC